MSLADSGRPNITQLLEGCQVQLEHVGGSTRMVPVLGIELGLKRALMIQWDMDRGYTLDLEDNQLVRIRGNRIIRRYLWKASDLEMTRSLYKSLKEAKELKSSPNLFQQKFRAKRL